MSFGDSFTEVLVTFLCSCWKFTNNQTLSGFDSSPFYIEQCLCAAHAKVEALGGGEGLSRPHQVKQELMCVCSYYPLRGVLFRLVQGVQEVTSSNVTLYLWQQAGWVWCPPSGGQLGLQWQAEVLQLAGSGGREIAFEG
ncbi:hypothetical protein XENOCAPTIV_003393 [Xenoophorus captivus]|uniref:Uncharacterized protein n=1 Tax=Xenoophorus captivus TaxID=1517983 RepID=A0ABV0QPN7_9TELE